MSSSKIAVTLAQWKPKSKRDRTKAAGAWVCPRCGQRLATVVFDFQSESRLEGGGETPEVALVLPPSVDRKKGTGTAFIGPFYYQGAHFEKTNRHAARQAPGQIERWTFDAHLAESRNERQAEYAMENLLEIKQQRDPITPIHLVADQLPATFKCSRPGCSVISQIEVIAGPEILNQIEKRDTAIEAMGEKYLTSRRYNRRKLAKDLWFG